MLKKFDEQTLKITTTCPMCKKESAHSANELTDENKVHFVDTDTDILAVGCKHCPTTHFYFLDIAELAEEGITEQRKNEKRMYKSIKKKLKTKVKVKKMKPVKEPKDK